jgi:hypothetical protein
MWRWDGSFAWKLLSRGVRMWAAWDRVALDGGRHQDGRRRSGIHADRRLAAGYDLVLGSLTRRRGAAADCECNGAVVPGPAVIPSAAKDLHVPSNEQTADPWLRSG